MNNILPNSIPMQQPNAPPLPPTGLPMRYANRRRPRRRRLNVGGVLGSNDFYPNMERNAFYPNIGGNTFYPNTRSYAYNRNIEGNGYYPPIWNSNYNYPMIDRPRIYRRNIFYNRNYLPQQPYYDYNLRGYRSTNQPQSRFYRQQREGQTRNNFNRLRAQSNNRLRSRSDQRRGPSQQRRQQRRRPRQLRLNDFMPPQLRDISPSTTTTTNLPNQFNLGGEAATATATTATIMAPPEALPQRERFRVNNVTQPFTVDHNEGNNQNQPPPPQALQQERITTSSFRRQQRRRRQQQYRQIDNNNRFAVLSDHDDNDNDMVDDDNNDEADNPVSTNRNKKMKIKNNKASKKKRIYLEPTRMLRWFEDNSKGSKNAISGRGNQAYVLATGPIYDQWVRDNYEMQVWQAYLKMGTEQKHWAKEVVQRTRKRDDTTNTRFVQKKINHFMNNIVQASATISDLQIQLNTYWSQLTSEAYAQKYTQATAELTSNMIIERTGLSNATTTTETGTGLTTSPTRETTASTITRVPSRDPVDRIEKHLLDYIYHCTQHVRKRAQSRIELAKVQISEYKAFEDFEHIATPSQWELHVLLKPRMKIWLQKKKNYEIMLKRVEYDLPPKFISNINFNFKIDESMITSEEVQATYNQMSKLTKDFRTQAMTLYIQSLGREYELLTEEIKRMVDCFPQDNDDGFDAEPGYAAFKQYHELREKRMKIEIERSLHFLDEQRVEGNVNQQQEPVVAPTLIRSLGEEFSLQQ